MDELQGCAGVRRSGRLRMSSNNPVVIVDMESSEESEEEEWNPSWSKAGSRPRRIIKASAEENAVAVDAVVHRLVSVKLSETKAKNPHVVADIVKSHVELRNSQIAVPQELVAEELDAMEGIDLVSGSSDDDDDSTDDENVEEEQEVLDRSLTSEGAALLAEVEKVLAGGGDLNKLRVDHLKAYLRHHGLRIAGVKAVLLSRIEDHLRLKDGQGERLYPRSSFRINCRGDVCIGDTVLFRHIVYNNDNVNGYKRHGKALGDRWVAGRIANESYGARKQQHTFTIEVFWSTGMRPFYVMQPILIKGRNLYRMTTMRQPWNNEADRLKALEEKHARGAEARAQRHRRIGTGSSSRGPSRSKPNKRSQSNTQAGAGRPPHHTNSTQQPRDQSRMESNMNILHRSDPATRPVPMPGDQARMESDRNIHTGRETHRHVPVARGQARVESDRNIPHGRETHHPSTRPVPMPGDQARMESDRNIHTGRATHRSVPVARGQAWVESDRNILHGRETHHPSSRPVPMARNQDRVESNRNIPSMMTFVPMGCSNPGCERAGAFQCIMRLCGPCCYRHTLPKGSCPRHLDIK